jgi:hypothetical protein
MIKLTITSLLLISLLGCQSTDYNSDPQQGNNKFSRAIENRQTIEPIMIIDPAYPRDVLSKPSNMQVLNCKPQGVFEQACIKSVSSWFFHTLDSFDESTNGLMTTCRFELRPVKQDI